jgi:hypothetical protein
MNVKYDLPLATTNGADTMTKSLHHRHRHPIENRLLRRINVKDVACILMKDGIFRGTVENISLGGLFVVSDIRVTAMDRLNVTIFLPSDSGGIDIKTDVVATRVENGGIGFRYDHLGHEEFWTLQTYLHRLSKPSRSTH